MNKITKTFNGHPVDIIQHEGKPWLVAMDIAKALGYRNASKVMQSINRETVGLGRRNRYIVAIINEAGIKELTTKGRKPESHRFGLWAEAEVFGRVPAVDSPTGAPSVCPLGTIIQLLQKIQRDGCACSCSGGSH